MPQPEPGAGPPLTQAGAAVRGTTQRTPFLDDAQGTLTLVLGAAGILEQTKRRRRSPDPMNPRSHRLVYLAVFVALVIGVGAGFAAHSLTTSKSASPATPTLSDP